MCRSRVGTVIMSLAAIVCAATTQKEWVKTGPLSAGRIGMTLTSIDNAVFAVGASLLPILLQGDTDSIRVHITYYSPSWNKRCCWDNRRASIQHHIRNAPPFLTLSWFSRFEQGM